MTPFEVKRRAAGFSQSALAAELGVTHGAVRKWDAGRQPKPDKIKRLAKALKMKPEAVVRLFAGETVAA